MNLLTLPSLCLLVAPIGSGKTRLLKYLALLYASRIKCAKIYSNSGRDAYEENYSWINQKYVSDTWDEDGWKNFLSLALRIKKNDPEAMNLLIFDDCIGMAKNLFKSQDAKKLITTLRFYNITLIISVQQIQSEVPTLVRGNLRDLFIFQQTDENGVKVLYESFGKGSQNLNVKSEFENKVLTLEQYHFLHWSRNTREIQEGMCPPELPDFRLYLHPEDKECGKEIIYGNDKNYDLSSIETEEIDIEDEEDDIPLFRKDSEEDENSDEDLSDIEGVDLEEQELYRDLPRPKDKKRKRTASKATRKQKMQKLEDELAAIEEEDQNEFSTAEGLARMRYLARLNHAKYDEDFNELVTKVFPTFFDGVIFENMDMQELKLRHRQVLNALAVQGVYANTKSEYELLCLAVEAFAKLGLGFEGETEQLKNIFTRKASTNVFARLGKIRPDKISFKSSVQDTIMSAIVPLGKFLLAAYSTVAVSDKLKEIMETPVDQQEADEVERELQEILKK
jgi:hypothetical protein